MVVFMDLEKHKIPTGLIKKLLNAGIKEEDFIYWASIDMDSIGKYNNGYVILTNSNLIIALAQEGEQSSVYYFGGLQDERAKEQSHDTSDWNVTEYPLDEVDALDVQLLVSGGLLIAKRGGVDHKLTTFTNSCMGEIRHLIKIYQKIKKGEELKEEDFEEKGPDASCPKCGLKYPNKDRKICPKCMDRRSIFFRVMTYFSPYKIKLIIMMLCFLLSAILNLAWPYLNGTILYDKVLTKNEDFIAFVGLPAGRFVTLLGAVIIVMILTSLTTQVIDIIHGLLVAKIVPDVVKEIKSQIFTSMGKLSVSFYSKRQTGGLMTRVLDDADRVTDFYLNGLPQFFIHIFTLITVAITMLTINWKLAIASLILLPLLTVISIKMLPRLWSYYGRRHRANRSLNAQINDNITGARVVKAFGQEESELKRFSNYNSRVRQAELSIVAYDNKYHALYSVVENTTSFIVYGFGAALVLSNTSFELGTLVTFIGYVNRLKNPLNFMSRIFRWWAESMNSAQRVFEIIDAVPEVQESHNPISRSEMIGEIELRNVTFGYESHKPVLKNVSFRAEAGKMLGIVGRSGAGKSTLVNLISRLYDVDEGEILIDGINVKELSFDYLRKNIAMVSQETYIFMGTVAQNIAYAKPDATTEEIIRAAVLASAHDFICKMPDGYDTMIGSAGRQLSGGERQRISIARAILANPKILILDEATASVDTETEQAIQHSLAYLVKGRTTLSIAHRLSTLKDADSLVVIDEGRLTEAGTHEELINLKGTYYKLMQLQTKALAMRGIE